MRSVRPLSALLLAAQLAGSLFAWVVYEMMCDENCTGHPWTATVGVAFAFLALLAAGALAINAWIDEWPLGAMFAATIVCDLVAAIGLGSTTS